jgi:hypothetical protein
MAEDDDTPDTSATDRTVDDQRELNNKEVIFARQLAEVYLLIDNVTNFANKELPQAPKNSDQFDCAFVHSHKPRVPDGDHDPVQSHKRECNDWLSQICRIPWPPHIDNENGDDTLSSKLVVARDLLNNAAAPANGMTIAFTQSILNERDPDHRAWYKRLWAVVTFDTRPASDALDLTELTRANLDKAVKLDRLANIAYPSMASEARLFIWRMRALFVLILAIALVTFSLSWVTATGTALLTSDQAAHNAVNAAQNAILTSQLGGSASASSDAAEPNPPSTKIRLGYDPETFCAVTPKSPPPSRAPQAARGQAEVHDTAVRTAPDPQPISKLQLCAELERQEARLRTAQYDLDQWIGREGRWWSGSGTPFLAALVGFPHWPGAVLPTPFDTRTDDMQWAEAWLHVIGGIVLPILYGMLGAGAAAARMLAAKMRDCTLTPRDGLLAFINLGLGSLIGGGITLFLNTDSASDPHSISHLSASASCFLAGFAVDGAYRMLERLSDALFNVEKTPVAKKQ